MPRVALTEKQADEYKLKDLSDAIMNIVKEKKGRDELKTGEVVHRLGVSPATWCRFRNEGLAATDLKTVYSLVRFAGYDLKLVKSYDTKKKSKTGPGSKDDTYGAIIEGFIRRIVIETLEEYKE